MHLNDERFYEITDEPKEPIIDYKTTNNDNNFDLIRLIAASFVLFTHCFALSNNGNDPFAKITNLDSLSGIGVLMFFTTSGYLVTQSLLRSKNIFDFYKKRALRIYPALALVVILSTFVLGPILTSLSNNEYFSNKNTYDYLANISGIVIKYNLPGVFTDNIYTNAINGSLWTIPLEIKCYIILGIVSLIPIKPQLKFTALSAIIFLAFAIPLFNHNFKLTDQTLIGANYESTRYYFAFAIGSAYEMWKHKFNKNPLIFAILFILAAIPLVSTNIIFSKFIFACGVIALTFSLGLFIKMPKLPSGLGDISYGVYLFAFPIQQTLAHFKIYEYGFWIYLGLSFLLSFAFAKISWELVEKPALKLKN